MRRTAAFRSVLVAALMLSLPACTLTQRTPFSAREQALAEIPGIPDARFWADADAASTAAARYAHDVRGPIRYLALSGGGGDGAFGAGVLKGWTESGSRPRFTIVSGVSTGALIAPFAFLGPAYDDVLKAMYTDGYGITLVDNPDPVSAVFGSGVFDSDRLLRLARQFVTHEVIAAIAEEHRKGRRLLIQTTNLDAQRPVVWNMGAIAASRAPGSEELFRRVMTASSSIPGIFTPTMISVTGGGKAFREMHVDGGVVSNVFILPGHMMFVQPRVALQQGGGIYILNNGKLDPSFEVVQNKTADIVGRSLSTMIASGSRSTLNATYHFARKNGLAFNLTAIPPEVDNSGTMAFDTEEMRKLYAFGLEYGRSGGLRSQRPPAVQADIAFNQSNPRPAHSAHWSPDAAVQPVRASR